MALIKCRECGKGVSAHAEVCPACGAPLAKNKAAASCPPSARRKSRLRPRLGLSLLAAAAFGLSLLAPPFVAAAVSALAVAGLVGVLLKGFGSAFLRGSLASICIGLVLSVLWAYGYPAYRAKHEEDRQRSRATAVYLRDIHGAMARADWKRAATLCQQASRGGLVHPELASALGIIKPNMDRAEAMNLKK